MKIPHIFQDCLQHKFAVGDVLYEAVSYNKDYIKKHNEKLYFVRCHYLIQKAGH